MANEDRIEALRKRVHRQEKEVKPMPVVEAEKPMQDVEEVKPAKLKSERGRHTFYLDKELVARVDQAFKGAAHDLYPKEIEKADYLEACLTYALEHQDEIKASLAHDTHA
jgi:hypothetical protein